MEYMTIKETAEKWNLSVRRVQTICNEGMIDGAMKFGNIWAIPRMLRNRQIKELSQGSMSILCLIGEDCYTYTRMVWNRS